MAELVDIVDANDNVLKVVDRPTMRKERLPHRSTYVLYLNSNNKVLVEIRTSNKDYAPGLFDACVGGVVAHDEDPIVGAKREFLEEIGLDCDKLDFHELGKMKVDLPHSFFYAYLFLAKGDGITKAQLSELSGIMYLSVENILALKDNFTKDSVVCLEEIIKRAKQQKLL